jgi:hypothetical protein
LSVAWIVWIMERVVSGESTVNGAVSGHVRVAANRARGSRRDHLVDAVDGIYSFHSITRFWEEGKGG